MPQNKFAEFAAAAAVLHKVNLHVVVRLPLCHKVNLPSFVARWPLCHKVNLPRCEARRLHFSSHLEIVHDLTGLRRTQLLKEAKVSWFTYFSRGTR